MGLIPKRLVALGERGMSDSWHVHTRHTQMINVTSSSGLRSFTSRERVTMRALRHAVMTERHTKNPKPRPRLRKRLITWGKMKRMEFTQNFLYQSIGLLSEYTFDAEYTGLFPLNIWNYDQESDSAVEEQTYSAAGLTFGCESCYLAASGPFYTEFVISEIDPEIRVISTSRSRNFARTFLYADFRGELWPRGSAC